MSPSPSHSGYGFVAGRLPFTTKSSSARFLPHDGNIILFLFNSVLNCDIVMELILDLDPSPLLVLIVKVFMNILIEL